MFLFKYKFIISINILILFIFSNIKQLYISVFNISLLLVMFRSVSFKLLLCQNRIFDCNNFILHNMVNIILRFCGSLLFLRSWFNSWLRRFVWVSLTLKTCDLIITWGRRMHWKCSFVFKWSLKILRILFVHIVGFFLCFIFSWNRLYFNTVLRIKIRLHRFLHHFKKNPDFLEVKVIIHWS